MSKEQKRQDFRGAAKGGEPARPPRLAGHGFDGPVRSKIKGGVHTKAELKRAGTPQGDRIGERSKGLS
ncbi:hypothetical protein [Streptomyces sp. NPDC012888]|uniref:hypothetical protein n=1 Tax=Streptomyces sp. NPDC012888 TaxID=3364855 RepID=UPI003699C1AB